MIKKFIKWVLNPNKQYSFTFPRVFYWGCNNYHFIKFYKYTGLSFLYGTTVNFECFLTITFDNGKFSLEKN